jgi:hypothetical protein
LPDPEISSFSAYLTPTAPASDTGGKNNKGMKPQKKAGHPLKKHHLRCLIASGNVIATMPAESVYSAALACSTTETNILPPAFSRKATLPGRNANRV